MQMKLLPSQRPTLQGIQPLGVGGGTDPRGPSFAPSLPHGSDRNLGVQEGCGPGLGSESAGGRMQISQLLPQDVSPKPGHSIVMSSCWASLAASPGQPRTARRLLQDTADQGCARAVDSGQP